MKIIQNNLDSIFNNWLYRRNYSSIFLLIDENTKQYCESILNIKIPYTSIIIKSGEHYKNIETCQYIWHSLLINNADRNSLLINLGGGVICDMGGFCASTYKRGIEFVNIPTTLLSQVDASVGSKTGIDFEGQKNMIGLFSASTEVFIYPYFLKTLVKRELLSGFAEVLKHGLIQNEKYYTDCLKSYKTKTIDWFQIVEKSIAIKTKVVIEDPLEKGFRKILNFGHTLGHAFESYSLEFHKNPILHGEAVILGIICSLFLSTHFNFITNIKTNRIISELLSIYNFKDLEKFNSNKISKFVLNDKKNISNKINFVILKDIEKPFYDYEIEMDELLVSIKFLEEKIFSHD